MVQFEEISPAEAESPNFEEEAKEHTEEIERLMLEQDETMNFPIKEREDESESSTIDDAL